MKPETEQNINEAIDWLQQTGASIQSFTTEQAPLYCKEVLAWEFYSAAFYLALSVAMLILAAFLARKAWKLRKTGPIPAFEACTGAAIFLMLVFGIVAAFACENLIKVTFSPRLVIVEHFRGGDK